MCETSPLTSPVVQADIPAAAALGSRRRRLWEVPSHLHCPVVGACLPLAVLRRIVAKAAEKPPAESDYDVHVAAVEECRRRGPLSEALQRELERRHALAIRRFAAARSAEAVLAAWREHAGDGDIAGPLWAALTHPRCDADGIETIHHEVHMLQHQAAALLQNDHARTAALTEELASLRAEHDRTRERYRQLQAQRTSEIETLTADLMRLRTDAAARETNVRQLREALEQAQAAVVTQPDTTRPERAARADARDPAPSHHKTSPVSTDQETTAPVAAEGAPKPAAVVEPAPEPANLASRAVLCVGGMHRSVAAYREIVEKRGGRFIHHDGGREDSVHRLDANLAAADLVICQAGCISHSAYWLVKDHCKRTGKRCVFLQKPSTSAFARGLADMSPLRAAAAA